MSMTSSGGSGAGWTVTSTQPAHGKDQMGQYVPGHQINVQLTSGPSFAVFVPDADTANLEKVRQLIAAKAAQIADINNLAQQ